MFRYIVIEEISEPFTRQAQGVLKEGKHSWEVTVTLRKIFTFLCGLNIPHLYT